jgi:hypothetical protein
MEIISHRGLWKSTEEKNSEGAFIRSVNDGFGIETDIRDLATTLVISHDVPKGSEMQFSDFCAIPGINKVTLALNIKADGLAIQLKNIIEEYELTKWFVFDMSIPDTLGHIKAGNKVFTRVSDIEPEPLLLEYAEGIWLDAFHSDWYSTFDVMRYSMLRKKVCIVSPELHKRSYETVWEKLYKLKDDENISLCTDFPDQALNFFK